MTSQLDLFKWIINKEVVFINIGDLVSQAEQARWAARARAAEEGLARLRARLAACEGALGEQEGAMRAVEEYLNEVTRRVKQSSSLPARTVRTTSTASRRKDARWSRINVTLTTMIVIRSWRCW